MENFPDQTTPGTPPEQSGSMQAPSETEFGTTVDDGSETGLGTNPNGTSMTSDDYFGAGGEFPGGKKAEESVNKAIAEAEKEEMDAFQGWYDSPKAGQEPVVESVNPAEYPNAADSQNPANPNPPVISQSPENPITANEPNTVTGQQPTPGTEIKEA